MFSKALAFATLAHTGQSYNGEPYIEHPKRVAVRVSVITADPVAQVSALLHDTVEDGGVTVADIRAEFGDEVANAVDTLTRREGENYMRYIERVGQHRLAALVKLADLQENLAQSYSPNAPAKAKSLRARYEKASLVIRGAIQRSEGA